ncbi:MAG: DUF3352 domain-containing protein [Nodosilinea sp.]
MKFRSFIRPLAIAAGLVLVLGLALLGRLTLSTPLYLIERGGQTQPMALQFVPKQSTVVGSVLVRPDRLATLWDYLAAPRLRQETRHDQELIEQALLASTGLSYDRDIRPWLGEEVTAALITPDLDQDPTNGAIPGYLVALACEDSAAAQAALELYWQNRAVAGDALTFEEFLGNRLIYVRQDGQRLGSGDPVQLATVLVANQYLLAANHPDVLRQALTAAQSSDLNLQSDRRYKTALKELPSSRVGLLALNIPAVNHWLHPDQAEAIGLGQLGDTDDEVGWGLMSWQLTHQGLMGHAALLAAQGHQLHPQQAAAGWDAIVPYLPPSLAVTAAGSDLKSLSQSLKPLLALAQPAGAEPPLLEGIVDQALGPGAAALLESGVDRAYGVGLAVAGASTPDWLLVAPQSNILSEALDDLGDLARQRGLEVGALDLRGSPAVAWTRLTLPPSSSLQPLRVVAEVAGLHAQVDQYEVLATSPATLDAVLHPGDDARRQLPAWWQQAGPVPGSSTGYVHIDWPQVQTKLAARLPQWRLWSAASQPALRHLQHITLVSGDRSKSMQTGSILVQLSNH